MKRICLLMGLGAVLAGCGGNADSTSTASISSTVSGSSGSGSSSSSVSSPSSSSSSSSSSTSSGGSSVSSSSSGVALTSADATRLLEQATFGPTASEVKRVAALGFDGYMQEQLAKPATGYSGFSYVPHTAPSSCEYVASAPTGTSSMCQRDSYTLFQVQRQFFENALTGTDQLRQRVAFALSQIFVVSGTEIFEAYGMAAYQNMLLNDAFINYRQLLEDVTLSPVMGTYLTMAQNAKPDPARGTSPNQNYGREVLQLFSIGVNQLNADGTLQLDSSGRPIPTYDQDVVEGFSSVFTGWTYASLPGATSSFSNPINYQGQMQAFPNDHDTSSKTLLNGVTVPAGQTPEADLKLALDTIFNHPNVGPFICKQLIQHLVSSNPSPAYVARVSAVFANNGQRTRGDMAAVVQAILGDVEARGEVPAGVNAGHLREAALFITTVLRTLGGQSDGVWLSGQSAAMGQMLFTPPSVFNFYPPGYELPGTTTLAPEFFVLDATTALARANFLNQLLLNGGAAAAPSVTGSTGTSVNLSPLVSAPAPSADALVDQFNTLLMHGDLSSAARSLIVTAVNGDTSTSDPLAPAKTAAYLITSSSQFQVEH